HEQVDLGARAEVHPLSRLVQDQDPRTGEEPARDERLLLVSARQAIDRLVQGARSDVETRDQLPAAARLLREIEPGAPFDLAERGDRDVVRERQVGEEAGELPILREIREAGADR